MNHVVDDVGGLVRIYDPVEKCCIDGDTHIVFGVDQLVGHIDDFGLQLHHANVFGQGVIIMESWFECVFEFPELLDEPKRGSFYSFVVAAAAADDAA